MWRYVLKCFLWVFVFTCAVVYAQSNCMTPMKKQGQCVIISKCPHLINIFNMKPLTVAATNYLNESICGFHGHSVKFCCDENKVHLNVKNCITGTGEFGRCTLLSRCAEYYELFKNANLTEKNIRLLRDSYCGGDMDNIKICCPDGSKTMSEMLSVMPKRTRALTFKSKYLPMLGKCGFQPLYNRVAYGSSAKIDEYPWMALLRYSVDNEFKCAGVLISLKYVLTAAHCVSEAYINRYGYLVSVRLGEHDWSTEMTCRYEKGYRECNEKTDVLVEKIIPHYEYRYDHRQNDIALIRLRVYVEESIYVRPVCLPNFNFMAKTNERLEIVGWGKTEKDYIRLSTKKQRASVPIVERSECIRIYGQSTINEVITDGQFCAGGHKDMMDACQGDSGGPLLWFDTVNNVWFCIGIISFGVHRCTLAGYPSVYTNVTYYKDWIIENVKP